MSRLFWVLFATVASASVGVTSKELTIRHELSKLKPPPQTAVASLFKPFDLPPPPPPPPPPPAPLAYELDDAMP